MSNLYFSHGDKGGVGKSLLSAVLVDHLIQSGRDVGIIEGDTGADIALRFSDIDLQLVNLNRSGAQEEAVLGFSEALEALAGKDIVVNLPAGA
ncbi:ATP-binding protein, partial [Acidithiobacillus ferridurans]|nr:ATP-binding protein [Acidithiobacillus ferridurans]